MLTNEYISATNLSKNTSATLDAFDKGEAEKVIILKNNSPKAVLLSMDAYKAMEEEIEDLRLASLALVRLETFDSERALSHKQIMEKFGK